MNIQMTAFDWLWELNLSCCGFFSVERPKQKERVSNSEMRRWFKNGFIQMNEKVILDCNEIIDSIDTITLFSNKRKTSFKFKE